MQPFRNSREDIINKALKENGYIIPTHEDDVEEFLKALEEHDIPPLPEHLNNPGSILDAPPPPGKIIKLPKNTQEPQRKQFAMAARDGKTISKDTMQKMMRDLANAKKKK